MTKGLFYLIRDGDRTASLVAEPIAGSPVLVMAGEFRNYDDLDGLEFTGPRAYLILRHAGPKARRKWGIGQKLLILRVEQH